MDGESIEEKLNSLYDEVHEAKDSNSTALEYYDKVVELVQQAEEEFEDGLHLGRIYCEVAKFYNSQGCPDIALEFYNKGFTFLLEGFKV